MCRADPWGDGADALGEPVFVDVDDKLHSGLAGHAFAELVHLRKLPGRIHVKQREGRRRRTERLLRQPHQHRTVLADGVEDDRLCKRGRDLAHDMNGFSLELVEMAETAMFRHGYVFYALEVGLVHMRRDQRPAPVSREHGEALPAVSRVPDSSSRIIC